MNHPCLNRRDFLRNTAGALLGSLAAGASPRAWAQAGPAASARPNVVMIFADDLNRRLGCYGDPVARTPHLDALAARGLRFDRAYCQNPVCLPSRTAMITGLRPETTGVFNNTAGTIRDNYPSAVTLPHFFRRAGYHVASTGKTFYSHGFDDPQTENEISILAGEPGRRTVGANPAGLAVDAKTRQLLGEKLPSGRMTFWGPLDCDDLDTREGQSARAAARFLREPPAQPFFLAVGFQRPHLPFVAPKKYFEPYDPAALPLPPVSADDLAGAPSVDLGTDYAVSNLERGPETGPLKVSESVQRRMLQAYYASISFIDAQTGVVLQGLRDSGLEQNTVVVFVSDNGFLFGEHGRWAKSWLYEESVRLPLIISHPGRTKPGGSTRSLVEFIDLYPTLAELCGLPAPAGLDGASFAPLLDAPGRPGKPAAFAINIAGERMVCTERWKLILHPAGAATRGQLYDLARDPLENHNLFAAPDQQATIAGLTALLPPNLKALTTLPATPERRSRRRPRT